MPSSEARTLANQTNAARSTGPKTDEGKAQSRANAFKHGMTGQGIVLPESDAIEVARRAKAFAEELNAEGEVGHALARRAALNSLRMERGADQQTVALSERIRRVEADFVAPEGMDPVEAAKLRGEAVRRAMFDPSKEATLARQYEAAAERGFYRAIKELRQMGRDLPARTKIDNAATVDTMMASFFKEQKAAEKMDAEFDALYGKPDFSTLRRPANSPQFPPIGAGIDLPISAARGR